MTTLYHAYVGGIQIGPLPKENLIAAGVRPDTLVWYPGLPSWTAASNVADLADIFPAPGAGSPFNPAPGQSVNQYGQPQYGQPQYGQPQYGQPQYGQPQYGQPQYGQPQYGQPQYGQPQHGLPADWTNWLPWAIISAVLGFSFSCIGLIFGIIAINNANKANRLIRCGQEQEARSVNNSAKSMTIVSLVLAGIGLVASVGLLSTGLYRNIL